jgi:hypothetical protein
MITHCCHKSSVMGPLMGQLKEINHQIEWVNQAGHVEHVEHDGIHQ